jgi:succinoglycan biosynthesis transport protein ExoP
MEGLAAGDEARGTAARIVGRHLDIRRVGLTAVVEVSYTSPSRRLSADVANALADAYIEQQLGSLAETTRRAGGWLEERIRELRDKAVTADRAVQEYKAANNIVDLGPALLSDQELTDTIELVAAARARFAEASARAQRPAP